VPVLKEVDLTVNAGDRLVLFGASGCGKTTLLHILSMLDGENEGSYHFEGENVSLLSETERARLRARKIGLVFQRFHLLPFHTVSENIQLRTRYLHHEPQPPPGTCEHLLEKVGLTDLADQPVRFLSGGEQQRVCIARALYQPPSLLLADEPTGNLDESNSTKIRTLFSDIAATTPVVLATHDPGWLSFATRVFRFQNGTLVEEAAE